MKNVIGFECCLKLLPDVDSRIAINRFRTSCHNFPIETGRYNNIPQIQQKKVKSIHYAHNSQDCQSVILL